ncbi:MAG: hypothetical protein V3U79_07435 [Dehalococcoidia bacterium]
MVTVPGFLLRRLYVKGSLSNSPEGVKFQLKNSLGSGYAKAMLPVSLDGEEYPLDKTFFKVDGPQVTFSSISDDFHFTLPLNKVITIVVVGVSLAPGPHKIAMGFVVPGLGKLRFDVKDEIESVE